jgi:hypothetical protein
MSDFNDLDFVDWDVDLDFDAEPFIGRRERAIQKLAEFSAFLARLKAGKAKPQAPSDPINVTGNSK